MKLEQKYLDILKDGKNLLAFSAGVDSTALFFILMQNGIEFDIAIVNYNLREQSKDEVEYAKWLAKEYNKKVFIKCARLDKKGNFESKARDFRYKFFKKLSKKEGYNNLILAHQLNDKLEWLLMRLSKGAGVSELAGMKCIEQRDEFTIVKPMLDWTKDELLEFLEENKIKYFVDASNFDKTYERNRFRPIVDELIKVGGKKGYLKSFQILHHEREALQEHFKLVYKKKKLLVIKLSDKKYKSYAVAHYLKRLGYLISGKDRLAVDEHDSLVVGQKWAIEYANEHLFISPYKTPAMPKEFKEICRVCKIPPKVRGYIFNKEISIKKLLRVYRV